MRNLGIAMIVFFLIIVAALYTARKAEAARWYGTEASYYTLYGNKTACGDTMSSRSWHVAELGGTKGNCQKRRTLCRNGRCVHVKIRDVGSYHRGRKWDLTPRVKRALRCGDLCYVRWSYGFN